MKQHPIPQNILDIEFKLFTKFTVREFVYMAVGIGFGGIFLYLFTRDQLPAIIAFPIFIGSSAMGLFLGLVPINDQQADIFLRNYIVAITNPTQRVWRNQTNDRTMNKEIINDQMQMTKGTMQRGYNEPGTAKIVGAEAVSSSQFVQNPITDQLDKEEEQRLAAIGVHSIPGVQATVVPQPPTPLRSATTPSVQPTTSSQTTQQQTIQTPNQSTQQAPNTPIQISRETLSNFTVIEKENTNLGICLKGATNQTIPNAIVAVKDDSGKILFAQRTDNSGTVSLNRLLPVGRYSIIVQTQQKIYNHIQLLSDGNPFPIVNILLNE